MAGTARQAAAAPRRAIDSVASKFDQGYRKAGGADGGAGGEEREQGSEELAGAEKGAGRGDTGGGRAGGAAEHEGGQGVTGAVLEKAGVAARAVHDQAERLAHQARRPGLQAACNLRQHTE